MSHDNLVIYVHSEEVWVLLGMLNQQIKFRVAILNCPE